MHIALAPHAIIFIAYPAAMTGGALVERIRMLLKNMAVDKPFFRKSWPADVTTAATAGMAGGTMIFPGCIYFRPFIHVGPGFKNSCKC